MNPRLRWQVPVIQKFRKRPVTIEAIRFHERRLGETIRDFERGAVAVAAWCGGRFRSQSKASDRTDVAYWIDIPTLEGVMRARPGDWIIKGVKGEFYPCKNEIFEATYEPADGLSRGEQVNEWTAERLEALPDGTVIEACDQEFWLCPDGWLDGDGGCLTSEDLIADTDPGSIRVVSVPIDALLSDEAIEAALPEWISPTMRPVGVDRRRALIRAAIAHVTGGEL